MRLALEDPRLRGVLMDLLHVRNHSLASPRGIAPFNSFKNQLVMDLSPRWTPANSKNSEPLFT